MYFLQMHLNYFDLLYMASQRVFALECSPAFIAECPLRMIGHFRYQLGAVVGIRMHFPRKQKMTKYLHIMHIILYIMTISHQKDRMVRKHRGIVHC